MDPETSVEIWAPVEGYVGLYDVSDQGRVRSLDRVVGHRWGGVATKRGRVLRPWVGPDGRHFVTLARNGESRMKQVHRLVAIAFIERLAGMGEVIPLDCNKSHNAVGNLAWSDGRGRHANDAVGAEVFATRAGRAKLTVDGVAWVRARLAAGEAQKDIATSIGVSAPTISRIANRKAWR